MNILFQRENFTLHGKNETQFEQQMLEPPHRAGCHMTSN